MDLNLTLNQLNLESGVIAIAIAALAFVLILLINRKRLLVGWREWRIQRCLARIGGEQLRNLICDDGLDGHYSIDRLALTRDAILVISYKPYGGNIYCAERISEWTQVVGQKSFKFENPLFELENQLTALRLITGNITLHGFLFFNHSAMFPKGHPDAVLNPENIPAQILKSSYEGPNPEILAAWELLKSRHKESSTSAQIGVKT